MTYRDEHKTGEKLKINYYRSSMGSLSHLLGWPSFVLFTTHILLCLVVTAPCSSSTTTPAVSAAAPAADVLLAAVRHHLCTLLPRSPDGGMYFYNETEKANVQDERGVITAVVAMDDLAFGWEWTC